MRGRIGVARSDRQVSPAVSDLLPSDGVHLFGWTPHASTHSRAKGAGKFALTFQATLEHLCIRSRYLSRCGNPALASASRLGKSVPGVIKSHNSVRGEGPTWSGDQVRSSSEALKHYEGCQLTHPRCRSRTGVAFTAFDSWRSNNIFALIGAQ